MSALAWLGLILVIAGESLALLTCRDIRRMLAFSTVSEFGYVLMGWGTGTAIGESGAIMHLFYQLVMRGLVFLSAARLVRRAGSSRTADLIGSYQAAPLTSLLFAFGMFSVMGLSPFKGSFSKFVVLYAGIESGSWIIAVAGTIGSIIAAIYFLFAVQTVCLARPKAGDAVSAAPLRFGIDGVAMVALAAVTIVMSLDPAPFLAVSAHLAGVADISRFPEFESAWSRVIILPSAGAFIVFAAGRLSARLQEGAAVLLAVATLALVAIGYHAGDLGDFFALLFAVGGLAVVVYSTAAMRGSAAPGRYYFFVFQMLGALIGVATSHHLGNFYLFWELMTWASYLLVVQDQTEDALKAGARYFLICTSGAYVMHFGILLLHAYAGTFDMGRIAAMAGSLPPAALLLIVMTFMVAFIAKTGLFPLHFWVPPAEREAPSAISAPMSALLAAAGLFGVMRVLFTLFGGVLPPAGWGLAGLGMPELTLVVLGGVTLLVGEIGAYRQSDIKRMLAYSTIAQMGEVAMMLGIGTSLALAGALMHVVNHALMKSVLFFCVGALALRTCARTLDDLRGLGKAMPLTAFPMAIAILAIMALPPFGGFVGKFLMIYAAVQAGQILVAVVMLTGGVIAAMYYARILRTLFFERYQGPPVAEAPAAMQAVSAILALLVTMNGLYPAGVLGFVSPVADALAAQRGLALIALPPLAMHWSLAALIAAMGSIAVFAIGRRSAMRAGMTAVVTMALALAGVLFEAGRYDLLSFWFAALIAGVGLLNMAYSSGYMAHEHAPNRYFFFFTMMIGGLLGLTAARNLFDFFAFWELMSSWTLYLVTIHEESDEALREGYKYFIFNFVGASFLFLGLTLLAAEAHSFALADLAHAAASIPAAALWSTLALIFLGLLMKAAQLPIRIDVQMHPVPAPTPVSGYISAVLLKAGPWGVLKVFVLLGAAATFARLRHDLPWAPDLMRVTSIVAAITILYAGAKAMVETGVKRLLIYSTVSQLGYVLLGLSLGTPLGIAGGLMHAVNHMLLKNTLFLVAGSILCQAPVRTLDELGGLGRRMPITFGIFFFAGLSVSGIPPFNGFSSKWMIYQACFESGHYLLGLAAMLSSLFTLAAILKFAHSAFMGPPTTAALRIDEPPKVMLVPMLLLVGASAAISAFPGILLVPVSQVQAALGLEAVPATWLGGVPGPLPWHPLALALALGGSTLIGWGYRRLSSPRRSISPIYTGGVIARPGERMEVPASSLYETPARLIRAALPGPRLEEVRADD
ncbi:proton-conducting transporter transmembrane domain-containing protein [Sphingomonas abietis]|uniref:Proton-conducting transporter membrane subunit n=1 Tax=Sphingomonas abietis TaxID=3012344 RepID=A0ABY7NZ08_9SPHN|nr:proton-conducting transporter membrane subunit [Sphingomonas abietis]WBO24606.1 proton-conducting transporter membrane subunit [Sphingomonas abietis]